MMMVMTIHNSTSKQDADKIKKLKQSFLCKGVVEAVLSLHEMKLLIEKNVLQESIQAKIELFKPCNK